MTHLSLCVPTATESKKNIFLLIIIMTLASFFVGCSAEREEDIPLFLRVGTYTGTIENTIQVEAIFSASTYSGGNIKLTLTAGNLNDVEYINLTKAQMTSTDPKLVITRPMDITIVFDSPTEITGAKATFDIPTGATGTVEVTIPLTKEIN